MPSFVCARESSLPVAEFHRVLVESGLGAIRPVDDMARLQQMLDGANLVVTARRQGTLIGVARCISDFAWCCYVSDLAVSPTAQGLGVGKALLDETRRMNGPNVSVILLSVADAVGFYERIGMQRMPDAFWFRRER